MSKIKWLIALVIAIAVMGLGFWFSSENGQMVRPKLLGLDLWELNLGTWLFLVFLAGGVTGYLISLSSIIPLKTRQGSMERKLVKKDREITRLRSTAPGS